MNKIQYSVYKRETGSAGGKAKNDAFDIALEMGFSPSYKPSDTRLVRVLQQLFSMVKIRQADVLFVQYPAIDNRVQEVLFKHMSKQGFSIALVHDLPSIQGMTEGDKELEIRQLMNFTYLIVHNEKMKTYLQELGYQGNMICLDLFDYLHDAQRRVTSPPYSGTIAIAGNLDKAPYICDLQKVDRYNFKLYGINKTLDLSNICNVAYQGCLPSDEIPYLLDADYGLVWDGDSVDTCSGIYGRYLLYNNPHKLSLYIAAGKPVIVWSKSAVADFVIKNNIGIAIDSLVDLQNINLRNGYEEMKQNVLAIKNKISSGVFLKTAIAKIEKDING